MDVFVDLTTGGLCPGMCPNIVWSGLEHMELVSVSANHVWLSYLDQDSDASEEPIAVCLAFDAFSTKVSLDGARFVATGNVSPLDKQQLAGCHGRSAWQGRLRFAVAVETPCAPAAQARHDRWNKFRAPSLHKVKPKVELCSDDGFDIQTNPVYNSSEEVILEDRKWNDIPAFQHFRGHTFEAEVSKVVMRLVRR